MDDASQPDSLAFKQKRRWVRRRRLLIIVLAIAVLAVNAAASLYLANTQPGDSAVYKQIALNTMDRGIYSTETAPPFVPTLIRLPGYPLFLAGIYSVFGEGNDTAVRVAQSLLHFAAAVFAGLLAWNWLSGKRRRRRAAAICTFLLAALCPFTINHTAVLLTEVPTIFLMTAMALAATYAIKSGEWRSSAAWWLLAGLTAGPAVEMRPDSAFYALGAGLTLVVAAFLKLPAKTPVVSAAWKGAAFTLVFVIVLTPWTIRNYRVFGLFQPVPTVHANMPDEFVPLGYDLWLKTWVTDVRYVNTMEWTIGQYRIDPQAIPARAFTNDDERVRVTELIDQYNNSDPDHPLSKAEEKPGDNDDGSNDDQADSGDSGDDKSEDDNSSDDSADQSSAGADEQLDLKITPEVDAAFNQIALERIRRAPFNYYFVLPATRIAEMWFDTHSEFYPFAGQIFPVKDMDNDIYQNVWLPLFAGLVWVYTLLSIAGLIFLALNRPPESLVWVAMILLITVPRLIFLGTIENPEPRYLIEYFVFAAVLAGIALSRISVRCGSGKIGLDLLYGRENRGRN
jgi:4-amino-4-deoxy-L-arabinose transferase-like glycosyltransferase